MKTKINQYLNSKWGLLFIILAGLLISRGLMYVVFCIWKNVNSADVNFFDQINVWDAGWYRNLAESGYALVPDRHESGDAANWAFFPLMPMIIRYVSRWLRISLNMAASVVNSIFFAIGLAVAGNYIKKTRGGREKAVLFIVTYLFGIYSCYFSIFYSESLFFLLVISFFHFMKSEKYILMGITGALASATRNVGVMLVFAIAAKYTMDFAESRGRKTIGSYFGNALKNYKLVLGTALIPLGLFTYMAFLGELMGDPLAFVHIQRAWGESGGWFRDVLITLKGQAPLRNLYFTIFGGVGLIGCLYLLKEKRWDEAIIGVIFIMIPFSVRTVSMPRYVIGACIPALGLNDIAAKFPAWIRKAIFLCLAVIELYLFWEWLNHNFRLI